MAKVDVYSVIEDVAKDINKQMNLEVAIPGKQDVSSDVKNWIPTSSHMLNLLMGLENLGAPTGRVIELFGDYSHGKSTILQLLMSGFQKAGGISNLLDSESSWNRERALMMGHDLERHLTIETDTVEQGFETIYKLNEKYASLFGDSVPIIYGWDTIAASPTSGEKEGDEFKDGMAFKARKIRSELRRLCQELPKANALLVVVNQTISTLNAKGPKKTTPGGSGLKFWASQRLECWRVGVFKSFGDDQQPAGIISQVKAVKNKLHPPNRAVDLPLVYRTGICPYREVINYHLDNTSIVNIAGAYRKIVGFTDKDISFYEKNTLGAFEEHPGLLEYLQEEVTSHWCGLS